MTYVVVSYLIMFLREVYIAYKRKQFISLLSWVWVAGAPATLPLTLLAIIIISVQEISKDRQ